MIDGDDFEAWRANPITQRMFSWLNEEMANCKDVWVGHSWEGGSTEAGVLYEMRGRAHVCQMVIDVDLEDLNGSDE